MKKLFIWYSIFVACFLLTAKAVYDNFSLSLLPYSWEWELAAFDRRMGRYQKAPSPRRVIVGSSYAEQLGEFGDFYNFGLSSTSAYEHLEIIRKYCRPEDHLYYLITLRDTLDADRLPRAEIRHPLLRQKMVLKGILLSRLGVELHTFLFVFDDKTQYDDAAIARNRELCKAVGVESLNVDQSLIDLELEFFLRSANIEPIWKNVVAVHPNTTFVLMPVLPLKNECLSVHINKTAESINRTAERMKCFRDLAANSGHQYVDLSDAVAPEHFTDFMHLDEAGREQVRDFLSSL